MLKVFSKIGNYYLVISTSAFHFERQREISSRFYANRDQTAVGIYNKLSKSLKAKDGLKANAGAKAMTKREQ